MAQTRRVLIDDAQAVAEAALRRHGASPEHAHATARSIVAAEAEGNRPVGFAHLPDYCAALAAGRADGTASPRFDVSSESAIRIDAQMGLPHLGVDKAWPWLIDRATAKGIGVLSLRNGFTCGALGYFARRLAEAHGLAGLVAANAGPAVMPAAGGRRPVFCSNPIAFAMPCGGEGAIVIDQSCTAGAYVNIQQAAGESRPIPEGWALDAEGKPTTNAAAALSGVLLPFGGYRGANIALIVELLAAGLTGGNWSCDAPAFNAGESSPGVGLLIIAIDPAATGGSDSAERTRRLVDFMRQDPAVHVPGLQKRQRAAGAAREGISMDARLWSRIESLATP